MILHEFRVFGLTISEFEQLSLKICVAALILYMVFIIGNLAKASKVGRYGALWLFLVLGFGLLGFLAKGLISSWLNIE